MGGRGCLVGVWGFLSPPSSDRVGDQCGLTTGCGLSGGYTSSNGVSGGDSARRWSPVRLPAGMQRLLCNPNPNPTFGRSASCWCWPPRPAAWRAWPSASSSPTSPAHWRQHSVMTRQQQRRAKAAPPLRVRPRGRGGHRGSWCWLGACLPACAQHLTPRAPCSLPECCPPQAACCAAVLHPTCVPHPLWPCRRAPLLRLQEGAHTRRQARQGGEQQAPLVVLGRLDVWHLEAAAQGRGHRGPGAGLPGPGVGCAVCSLFLLQLVCWSVGGLWSEVGLVLVFLGLKYIQGCCDVVLVLLLGPRCIVAEHGPTCQPPAAVPRLT